MADAKISELAPLAGGVQAGGDLLPIVDVSASQTKRITLSSLFSNLPVSMSFLMNNPSIDFNDPDSGNTAAVVLDNTGLRFDVNGVSSVLRIDQTGVQVSSGATGTFTTADSKTVTVTDGIITDIA